MFVNREIKKKTKTNVSTGNKRLILNEQEDLIPKKKKRKKSATIVF